MFLLLSALAFPCDEAVLSAVAPPKVESSGEIGLVSGTWKKDGKDLAGAIVSFISAAPVEKWRDVLLKPEDQEEWQGKEFGTKRVERVDAEHTFQATDIEMMWGAVRIQRQTLVNIRWKEKSAQHLHNCWQAVDPEPYLSTVGPWVEPGVEWNRTGYGGWDVRPRAEGGTLVTYQFWVQSSVLLPSVQGWAMSRTLPDLMKAFEAYLTTGG